MLQMSEIPVHHAGKMTAYLLHNSEKFFPPLNGACTLANLIMTITAYLKRNESPAAAAKLPWVGASLALNLATTAWALGIMVPMNKAMARLSEQNLTANSADEKSEKEFRGLQARWRTLNYGKSGSKVGTLSRNYLADFRICYRSRCDHARFLHHCSVRPA